MPLEPGSLLAGKYRIESVIGQGAYGRVYRARDIELERAVAIKELRKGEGEVGSTIFADYADRFRREARVQARFNHATIVQVHELLLVESDALYLVMEYMEGGSLRQRLDERPRMKVGQALRLMNDLLNGLERVHTDPRDIVHRDIKPANILLTREGWAKLGDFGLAQVGDESMRSMSGKPHPGTPQYMSPEQASTTDYLSPASDIFSAGCVLFEILSGTGYKQARFQKKTLKDLCPGVPAWLIEISDEMLAQDQEQRAHDARKLRERLRQGLRDQKRQKADAAARRDAEQVAAEEKAHKEAEERQRRELTIELAPGVRMEFVRVPAGEFLMGSDKKQDLQASDAETPQHRVHLDEYLVGKYPVTVAQFAAFIQTTKHQTTAEKRGSAWGWDGSIWNQIKGASWQHPSGPQSDVRQKQDHPVTCVSWEDAAAFCKWASGVSGRAVRLPTEAEWEKAARGADGRRYPWGSEKPDKQRANFDKQVKDTTPVGKYSPQGDSPYACADMAGNVWEWVADWYGADYYQKSPDSNPTGPSNGSYSVLRGGSWNFDAYYLRVAYRYGNVPEYSTYNLGFRCALSPGK